MDRKIIARFALSLVLAFAGLIVLFGLLGEANGRAYAAELLVDAQPADKLVARRALPRRVPLPETRRAPLASLTGAPLLNGVEASTVITVCLSGCDYDSIQAAVNAAPQHALIKVAQGVYTGTPYVVELTKTLTLQGGYTQTDWMLSNPDQHPTVLDGEGSVQVVLISSGNPTVEGFHIRNGAGSPGAGIYITGGNPLIRRNRIYRNQAGAGEGGGVYVGGGTLTLENNLIYTNTVDGRGAGVYLASSGAYLVRYNTFYDNRSTGEGGGIYVDSGSVVISASIIVSNVASNGGGIYREVDANAQVLRNDVFGNANGDYVGGTLVGNNSFDPRFEGPIAGIDPADMNFRLAPNSQCIGRDDPNYPTVYPDDDYDGYARPFGPWADIGAHEFYTGTCFSRVGGGQVYTNVQAAVLSATVGAEVWVAGYCIGEGENVVDINKDLILRGGYTKTYWVSSNPDLYRTVLDGEGQRRVIYIDQDGTAIIEGFDIYNGYLEGDSSSKQGGGIYVHNNDSDLVIRHNRIYSNQVKASGRHGGGVYVSGNEPMVMANEIYSNVAGGSGGGVYVASNVQSATIEGNHIYGNLANNGAGILSEGGVVVRHSWVYSNATTGPDGGGFNCSGGESVLEGNWVYDNRASRKGGGVYASSSCDIVATGNHIYNNRANGTSDDGGGGIYVRGIAVIRGNVISGNVASQRGGGVYAYDPDLEIEQNRIYGNYAGEDGGGVLLRNEAIARNNLVYTNTADAGGGGFGVRNGYVINNVVYDNQAGEAGGGVYKWDGSADVYGNIVVSNTSSSGGSGIDVGSGDNARLNDLWGNTCQGGCSDNLNADPLFEDWVDFYLQPGSPCIDAITTTDKTYYADYDYDGYARPFGPYADMGAHEFYTGTCFARLSDGGRVYATIQDAVITATTGVSDVLVAGICQGDAGLVTLDKSLGLYGGYEIDDWTVPMTETVLNGGMITITADGVTVGRFVIKGSTGPAIHVDAVVSPTIQNVIAHENAGGGFVSSQGGSPRLYNNTFVNNTGDGISLSGSGSPVISNTIVVSNTNYGINDPGDTARLAYNNVTGNAVGDYNGVSAGVSDVKLPPRFRDWTTKDFRLAFDSPCIHWADPNTGLAVDFEGDDRPAGTGYDIGADEADDYLGLSFMDDEAGDTIPNQVVEYTHYLTNTGTREDVYVLTHTCDLGWDVGYVSVYTLSPGEETSVLVSVTVPSGVVSGTQATVLLTATSQTGRPYFFDTVSNTTLVRSGWQFALSPTTDQQTADRGDVVTYTHILTNQGATDSYTLTLSSGLGWAVVIPSQLNNVGTGVAETIRIVVDVPSWASGGAVEETVLDVTSVGASGEGRVVQSTVTDTTDVTYDYGDRYVAVSGNDHDGLNSCLAESDPCRTIEQAIRRASEGETIKVATGTYQEYNLSLNETVVVRGGYTTSDWSTHSPDSSLTVIDAGQNGRVFFIVGDPTVEFITLQNGRSTGFGGGVYVAQGAEPTLRRVRIVDNAALRGGGIYNAGGDLTFEQSVVLDNEADQYGGGFYNMGNNTDLFSNVFYNNEALDSGGGFYNADGSPRVWNDTFVYNVADYGGGIFLDAGSPIISNTIIYTNTANEDGGGIYNEAVGAVLAYNNAGSNTPNNYNSGTPYLSENPDFEDAAGGNFHLLKGSPCIDVGSGVDMSIIAEDLDGQPRWMNDWPDIGADEYQWAGVALVSLDDKQMGVPGSVLTFTHILTNDGTYDDAYHLTWRQSLTNGWTVMVNGYTTAPITTPVLGRYETMAIDVVANVPSGFLSGTVNLVTLTATSQLDEDVSATTMNDAIVERVVDVSLSPNVWFNQTGWQDTNKSVVYTHTLVNTGNYTDVFEFSQWSSQATVGSDPWPVSVWPTPTVELGMGSSRLISVTVDVPSYAEEINVHKAIVTATSQASPNPYAVVTDTTVALWEHNVAFAPDHSAGGDEPGETVEHVHYLTNTGNYTDTFLLTAYSQRGWPVSFSPSPTVTLRPTETQQIKVSVDIPIKGVAFGGEQDTTLVTVTSLSSRTVTANVTDVTTATHVPGVTVYPSYDLTYEDEVLDEAHQRVVRLNLTSNDQTVVFTHTVWNNNTSNSTDTFTLTVSAGNVVPAQTGSLAWHEEITSYVTVTASQAVVEPTYAPFTKTVLTAQSWFSPTTQDEVVDVVIVNQWLGVDLSPGQERYGPPNGPPGPEGVAIAYKHRVTNTGNYTDSFELSSEVNQSGWDVAFSGDAVLVDGNNYKTVDIGPHLSRVITVEVTVPYVLCGTTGLVSITAESRTPTDTVDYYNLVTTTMDTIVVDPVYYGDMSPDLTLRYVSSSTARLETYMHWLTNTGNCTNTFNLGAQGGFTPTLDPMQTGVLSSNLETSNYSAPVAVTVTIPGTDISNLLVDTVVITADGVADIGATDRVTRVDNVIVNQQVNVGLDRFNTAIISAAGQVRVDWFTHTLTNLGNYTDTFDLTTKNEDGWQVSVNPVDVTLPPKTSLVIDVEVRVPADVYTATNSTWITATSQTPLAGTVKPYTPTATVMDTVQVRRPAVSLGPDDVRIVDHGETITYTRMLRNVGGLADTYTVTLSSGRGWAIDWSPRLPDNSGEMAPGLDRTVVVSLFVPYGTDYRITDTVLVTATSGISYTYVVSDVAVDVVQMEYDLQAELVPTYTLQVMPEQTITRYHTLTNTGNYTETFILSVDQEFVDVESLTPRETTLAPGDHVPVTVTMNVPPHAAGGEFDDVEILVRKKDRESDDPDPVTSVVDRLIVSYVEGDRHVAPTGSDVHNNCTMVGGREPCRTVQHAVDQARHGDTVKVAQGTYVAALETTEVVLVSKSITLTGGYAIDDWVNADPVLRSTRLDAQDVEGRRVMSIGVSITPTVQGFHLLRGNVDDDGAGLYISTGATPTIRLNRIYNNTAFEHKGGGIYYGGGGHPILERNAIYGNEARTGAGVYLESGETMFWNNLVYHNVAEFYGGGLYSYQGNPAIYFNTLYNNEAGDGGGCYIASGAPSISNTIVTSNTGNGIRWDSTATYSPAYNNVWDNAPYNYYPQSQGQGVDEIGAPDISVDPRLADALSDDLRLTFNSPCIDAGDPNTSVPMMYHKDYEGNDRQLRDSYDIGAYEYGFVGKKLYVDAAQPAEVITYTIRVTNTGSVAHTVRVTDTLHRYLDYTRTLMYSQGMAEYLTSTRVVSWTVYVTGETVEDLTFMARIKDGVAYGTLITNVTWIDQGYLPVVTTTVTAIQGTRYVAPGGDDEANDCTLEYDPCRTVQHAVDQAQPDDEVKIAEGTYSESLVVSEPLVLSGGYPASARSLSEWDDFEPLAYTTTLQNSTGDVVSVVSETVRLVGLHVAGGTNGINVANEGGIDLYRSWVHENSGDGLVVTDGTYTVVNSIVAQNTGMGLRTSSSNGVVIHSTFADNNDGMLVDGNAYLTNTIFSTHTTALNVTSGSAELWNTLWWGGGTYTTGNVIEQASVITNPLFVSPGEMDYHIQQESGAVDKGVDTYLTEDIDGEAREVMEAPDIGADEYPVGLDKYGPEFAVAGETVTYRIELKAVDVGLMITDVLPNHLTFAGTVTCTEGICDYRTDLEAITWNGDSAGDVAITYTAGITNWLGRGYVITNSAWLMRQGYLNESAVCETVITPVLTTRYVATNGVDVETDGTPNSCQQPWKPCATVQWAVGQALDGDTIKVAGGQYTSTVGPLIHVDKAVALTGGCRPIDWTCDPSNATYLDGEGARQVMLVDGTAGPVTVDGFHILNGQAGSSGGIRVNDAIVVLSRNRIYSNTASSGPGGGLYGSGGDVTLLRNRFYANAADTNGGGIYAYNTDFVMVNNIIVGNNAVSGGGLFLDGTGARQASMLHNTIANNVDTGIYVGNYSVAMTNTIIADHTVGVVAAAAATVNSRSTLWWNNAQKNTGTIIDGTPQEGDPWFVNPNVWDYHIGLNSQARDTGWPVDVDVDIDGDRRPAGSANDIGADELSARLEVVKVAEPAEVRAGGQLTYTITVTNTGDLTLTVDIVDTLPGEVSTSDDVSWSGISINSGDVWKGTIGVTATEEISTQVVLTNVVQATALENATDIYTETSLALPVNREPNVPSNPDPTDTAQDVSLNPVLDWDGGDPDSWDTLIYTVAFGTSDPPPVVGSTSTTNYAVGPLAENTTYYWAITATDGVSTTAGPVWHFTTLSSNLAPYVHTPDPSDGAIDVPLTKSLSWIGGDDNGDPVTYTVALGTSSPPPIVAQGLTMTSYIPPSNFVAETTYYWVVTATDGISETMGGPWTFTTGSGNIYLPLVLRNG